VLHSYQPGVTVTHGACVTQLYTPCYDCTRSLCYTALFIPRVTVKLHTESVLHSFLPRVTVVTQLFTRVTFTHSLRYTYIYPVLQLHREPVFHMYLTRVTITQRACVT